MERPRRLEGRPAWRRQQWERGDLSAEYHQVFHHHWQRRTLSRALGSRQAHQQQLPDLYLTEESHSGTLQSSERGVLHLKSLQMGHATGKNKPGRIFIRAKSMLTTSLLWGSWQSRAKSSRMASFFLRDGSCVSTSDCPLPASIPLRSFFASCRCIFFELFRCLLTH